MIVLQENHLFIHLLELLFGQGVPPLQFLELATEAEVTHVEIVEVFVENCVVILEILGLLNKIAQLSPRLVQLLRE